jgi:hypothetical protein
MDEEMLMSSIMKDIDECKDKRSETLKRKMYLVDSPLRSSIETLIMTGYSFSDAVIKAYEDYTIDLEGKIKNYEKGYVLIETTLPRVDSGDYDTCELNRFEREKKMKGE